MLCLSHESHKPRLVPGPAPALGCIHRVQTLEIYG